MITCAKCKKLKPKTDFYSDKEHKNGRKSWCKACYNEHKKLMYTTLLINDPSTYIFYNAKCRAKKYKTEFTITPDFIKSKLAIGKCEVTKIPFEYKLNSIFIPSIDRIDSSKGYTPDNVQIVCRFYNNLKGTYTDKEAQDVIVQAGTYMEKQRKLKARKVKKSKNATQLQLPLDKYSHEYKESNTLHDSVIPEGNPCNDQGQTGLCEALS